MKALNTKVNILAVLGVVLITLMAGCHTGTLVTDTDLSYEFYGAAVKLIWWDISGVQILINSDDSVYADASVKFSGDSLVYASGIYQRAYQSVDSVGEGVNLVTFQDGINYNDTVFSVVPGHVTDTVTGLPDNRINPAGDVVTVDFTAAANAEGYVLAVAPKDSLGLSYGYSAWVATGATSVTIPREAFRLSGGLEPDTGWYYVFVYAYADSPDSAAASAMLPVPMPGNLADNIADERFKGRFGAVVVSAPDSVHVVAR